jgi:hypothetical protein
MKMRLSDSERYEIKNMTSVFWAMPRKMTKNIECELV